MNKISENTLELAFAFCQEEDKIFTDVQLLSQKAQKAANFITLKRSLHLGTYVQATAVLEKSPKL
jgi:hypothetical protein